uniref:NAT_SF domain containing protein n=1 Tax=uncultured Caudovirales phage TaxID=2100421 RepID=A0A6J5L006_9CAUD|nr:NAT_SF domain containing protein [uncultured Caudovirales phage]
MTERKIDLHTQLAGSPGEVLLVTTALNLLKSGHTPTLNYNWNAEVLTATVDGKCVAALAFQVQAWRRTLFVEMGATEPDAKRQGHYRALWDRLVQIAQERKLSNIESGYVVTNTESEAMHKALGRPVIGHITRFAVPEPATTEEKAP